jgi:hypothetical protein
LDAEKAARQLSERGRQMYELRHAGFEWREIAQILKTTDAAAQAEFSRDLRRAKLKMKNERAIRSRPARSEGAQNVEWASFSEVFNRGRRHYRLLSHDGGDDHGPLYNLAAFGHTHDYRFFGYVELAWDHWEIDDRSASHWIDTSHLVFMKT